jgi:hypothetical protein
MRNNATGIRDVYRFRSRRWLIGAVVLAAAVFPVSAGADTQPVSGTTTSALGMTVSGAVALTNFSPGQSATGNGIVTITSTGPWVLRIQDASATNPGHMLRTTGSTGATALAQGLQWLAAATQGGTGASGTLSGTAAVAASGTLSDVVNVTYSQPIGAAEQVALGSVYSLTVTWTVSPT